MDAESLLLLAIAVFILGGLVVELWPKKEPPPRQPFVPWYGEHHTAERAKYVDVIREHGGICMERDCILPTRRIEAGAYWHLAHDHERGGPRDYLGPAHPECNEDEARRRGVTWDEGPQDPPPIVPPF